MSDSLPISLLGASPLGLSQSQPRNLEEARAKAEEFEAVFLSTYLKTMFSGVMESQDFGANGGEKNFRELLIDEYGKSFAASGGIGLADSVLRELIAIQERG